MTSFSITAAHWRTAPFEAGDGDVLFDIAPDRAARFFADLRRMNAANVRWRWSLDSDDDGGRVFAIVSSPPSLLISRVREQRTIRAFREQWPGIWVALGHWLEMPTPAAASGEHLLLWPPKHIERIPADFETQWPDFQLEEAVHAPTDRSQPLDVATRLRLLPTPEREPPRLWILRDDALGQLTAYCRSTHQQLLSRYSVAVSASSGRPCVALRALTSKGPLPVFVGAAIAYVPLLKLPNVFIPAGTRLAPPLRRDAIRQAFNASHDRIVWLHPANRGEFQLESLSEKAFHSLSEWVDYRVLEPTVEQRAWSPVRSFPLGAFIERAEPKPPVDVIFSQPPIVRPADQSPGLLRRAIRWFKPQRKSRMPDFGQLPIEEPSIPVDEAVRTALNQGDRLKLARPETANSANERCQVLEAKLLRDLAANPNSDQTNEQWATLAAAYDSAGNHKDAAICWMNAVWGSEKPTQLWSWGWLRAEAKAGRAEVKVIDPAPWLSAPANPGTTRALAAWVVWASQQSPPPNSLKERASEITARLDDAERFLPIRSAWLARGMLARSGGTDVLALARTRDRLSDRLMSGGMSLEIDTPSFLRFAGDGVRERFHEARRWLVDKRDMLHQWISRIPDDARFRANPSPGRNYLRHVGLEPEVSNTRAYADLMLAWGLTRFGEHFAADGIRKQAVGALSKDDPVHAILLEAFERRIQEVREGKPPRGPLPGELLARIERTSGTARYAIDKLREHSRILEPTVRIHAFQSMAIREAGIANLEGMPSDRLNETAKTLIEAEMQHEGQSHSESVLSILLDRTLEWREETTAAVFGALPRAIDRLRDAPRPQSRMLEKGLAAAAVWDRVDIARELVGRFLVLADGRAGWDMAEALTGHTFRCLRKLGLKNDADRVLHHVAERILNGQPVGKLRATRPTDWPIALRCLLHAAAGWYYAGRDEQAHAILDEARHDLFSGELLPPQRTALALTYASTLAQAPARVALGRLEEVFQRLKGISVEGTTNAYYALNPLLLIERAVRAVVSDDFSVGPQVRAWLDVDELAVRRRIRDELREMLNKQGL